MRRVVVFFSLLGIGIWLFVDQIFRTGFWEVWKSVSSISLWAFGLYVVLSLFNMCIYTLRWDIILHHHHQCERIPFFKLLLHRISAYAMSYLTPAALTGGEPLRIFYLKEDGVPVPEATSATVIDKVLELSMIFIFVVSGGIFAVLNGSFPDYSMNIVLGSFGVLFLLIFWFYYATLRDIGFLSSVLRWLGLTRFGVIKKFEEKVIEVEVQMANFYRGHLRKLFFLIFLSVLTLAFMVFEHWYIAQMLGVELGLKQAFLSGTIPGVSYIIPIPGALGALEHSHKLIFDLLGVGINAFAFVVILRMRDIVFVVIGLIHASTHGVRMVRDVFFKT